MSIFRDFILILVKLKHRGGRSQISNFSSSEVKQRSRRSQIFPFNSREVKQRSKNSN